MLNFQQGFERGFSTVRDVYHGLLQLALGCRKRFLLGFLACVLASFSLLRAWAKTSSPPPTPGPGLHVRLPLGTRIEESAATFDRIEARIREVIPAEELNNIVDNIGIPLSGIDMAYSSSGTIGRRTAISRSPSRPITSPPPTT
ncbi:hypothetical protein QNM99_11740 [Pseudomonas sp. PCH446]